MDVFLEKIVEKKKTAKDILIILAALVGVPVVYIIAMNLPYISQVFQSISMSVLLLAVLIYLSYALIKSTIIEYEYIITNGDLDIDVIIARNKRKRIFSANSSGFELLAPYKGTHYNQKMENIKNRIEAVSSMQDEGIYFITLSYNGEPTIVFFQPTEKMIDSLKRFNPRNIYKDGK